MIFSQFNSPRLETHIYDDESNTSRLGFPHICEATFAKPYLIAPAVQDQFTMLKDEVRAWLIENLGQPYECWEMLRFNTRIRVSFANKNDLIMFLLRFK